MSNVHKNALWSGEAVKFTHFLQQSYLILIAVCAGIPVSAPTHHSLKGRSRDINVNTDTREAPEGDV